MGINSSYDSPTLFIGGGNMAQAIVAGLLVRGVRSSLLKVVEIVPEQQIKLRQCYPEVTICPELNRQLIEASSVIILAVKPAQVQEVIKLLSGYLDHGSNRPGITYPVVMSIAAGIQISALYESLGGYAQLVRAMPNIPVQINQGITALYSSSLNGAGRSVVESLWNSVGHTIWVAEEKQLDVITAVSGCGPAYFFYWSEALAKQAEVLGLPPEIVSQLVLHTLKGAAALAENLLIRNGSVDWQELKNQVASKGGSTEAALQVLQQGKVAEVFALAIQAAAKRAEEMTLRVTVS